ncbi:hypothetical protein [Halioglobus sp. Uisw_031]|uniref:hypothetical protein n=1 Tax=Halioglobus sp. Uisw_031 TaxID=3230977 RepID=UPI0039EB0474
MLPADGLAGFLGPITLALSMQSADGVKTISWWLYVASGVILICVVLFHVLRRMDCAQLAMTSPAWK